MYVYIYIHNVYYGDDWWHGWHERWLRWHFVRRAYRLQGCSDPEIRLTTYEALGSSSKGRNDGNATWPRSRGARWLGVAKLYESGVEFHGISVYPIFWTWKVMTTQESWIDLRANRRIVWYIWICLDRTLSSQVSWTQPVEICKSPEVFIRKRYGGQTDPTAVKELIVSQLPIADHSNHPNHPIQWSKLIINHQTQNSIKLHPSPSPIHLNATTSGWCSPVLFVGLFLANS